MSPYGDPMTNDDTTPSPEELAALYAAGALPPDEASAVESRVDAGDRQLAEEIASYDIVFVALAEGSEPAVPNSEIKERLLEQAAKARPNARRRRRDRLEDASTGFVLRRGESRKWVDLDIPGIQECLLYHDPLRKIETKLVRVAPGMTIPAHRHPGVEGCYLLEGDLHTYGKDLLAGDYMVAPRGSVHPDSYTKNGCLFLVTVIGNTDSRA
jgi:anti-sigma factor ChrR (cupin superfamily)